MQWCELVKSLVMKAISKKVAISKAMECKGDCIDGTISGAEYRSELANLAEQSGMSYQELLSEIAE